MTRVAHGFLVLLPVGLFALVAGAQDPREPQSCQSLSGASRTRARACGQEEKPVEAVEPVEQEFTLTLEKPPLETALCKATLDIEYLQVNSLARVTGVINNGDCAASSGEYTIQARVRNDSGATKELDFQESWQRDDDQPVHISGEYPIGQNVELLRIRSTGLRCECAEARADPESATAQ